MHTPKFRIMFVLNITPYHAYPQAPFVFRDSLSRLHFYVSQNVGKFYSLFRNYSHHILLAMKIFPSSECGKLNTQNIIVHSPQ